jgi:hypothetical protein
VAVVVFTFWPAACGRSVNPKTPGGNTSPFAEMFV